MLWCLKRPDLYGPGLAAHGLDPARLVLVAARRDEDILWAVEEGLRTGAAAGSPPWSARSAGCRWWRAAGCSSPPSVPASPPSCCAAGATPPRRRPNATRPSAAVTRWRVAALPSADIAGNARQSAGRAGGSSCCGARRRAGHWEVEVADATGHVCLSAELADRPAAPVTENRARARAEPLRAPAEARSRSRR